MPLIIGELNARIEVEAPPLPAAPVGRPTAEQHDEEARRMRALSAARLEAERRIEQRDPERLGAA
jgi:hypothetical protein